MAEEQRGLLEYAYIFWTSGLCLVLIGLTRRIKPRQAIHRYFIRLNISFLIFFLTNLAFTPMGIAVHQNFYELWKDLIFPTFSLFAYVGLTTAGVHWLLVAASYSGRIQWLHGWRRMLLFLPTALCVALLIFGNLIDVYLSFDATSEFLGLLDWIAMLSGFAYTLWAAAFYIGAARDATHTRYRKQAIFLIIIGFFPIIGSIADQILGMRIRFPTYGFLFELGFTISSVILGVTLWQRQLMDLVPVALREVFRHMNDGVLVVDSQLRILQSNDMARRMFPHIEAGVMMGETAPAIADTLSYGVQSNAHEMEFEIQHEGLIYWVRCVGLLSQKNNVGWIVMVSDITERKHMEDQLAFEALHDQLTGLPNRTLLMDRIEQVMKRANRSGRYDFALMFLDLNEFKDINDRYGHACGDVVLKEVGKRIKTCLRAIDTVARLGGDEFVILLEGVDDRQAALDLTFRIQAALEKALVFEEEILHPTASIGIVMGAERYNDPKDLLHDADLAMYAAKEYSTESGCPPEEPNKPSQVSFSMN